MTTQIDNVIFSRFLKQSVPFELISLQDLHLRASERSYDLSVPHRIDFHALIIISEGKGYHTVDFKKEVLLPGTVIAINKGQVHSFSPELSVRGYVIGFEEDFLIENSNEKNLFQFLQIFHASSIKLTEESLNILRPVIQLIERFLKDENANLKSEIIYSTFMVLLFQIKRLACNKPVTFDSQRFKDFYRLKKLISRSYQEMHNAKEFARRLDVSYNYLNEVCKEIVNKTAKEFIDSWLLLEIKRCIAERKYTSQEIAFHMGFKEPSNFIRFFKKHTGLTPLQFQEGLKSRFGFDIDYSK